MTHVTTIECIPLLGSRLSQVNSYATAYAIMAQKALHGSCSYYITVNNAHTLVEAARRPEYSQIINESLLALADGQPLSVIARLRGAKQMQRIFGPTLFEKSLEWGQQDGLRHFFFGNTPETLERMRKEIVRRFPDAIVAGMIAPPFRPFTDAENQVYVAEILACEPDIIWVSLGAPRQEEWIYQHYRLLNRGVFVGIGAGFSYLAGTIRHAPNWMKHLALEWLYRLYQEPRRLFRRYLVYNSLFVYHFLKEALSGKKQGGQTRVVESVHEIQLPQD